MGGGCTCTKATITSWTVPRAQWYECVCKMMWKRPFAKQSERRGVGVCMCEMVVVVAGGWRWLRMIAFAQ